MPRFFIDDRPQGELYTLTGENAHHAGRVLRLRPGETLTLCDGAGTDFDCTVEQAEKDEVVCRVQAVHPSETEPRQDMTLFMALLELLKLGKAHVMQTGNFGEMTLLPGRRESDLGEE